MKEVICTATLPHNKLSQNLDDTVREVVTQKKKRERKDEQIQTEPGENSKFLRHNMEVMAWERPDMTNKEQVAERIEQYFSACERNDMKPSVEGLALAFSVNRRTLWKWVNGIECQFIPDVCRDTLKKAYNLLNSMMADYMQNNRVNPVVGIFLMKNNMGYADQTEIVVTPNNPLGEVQDPDTIAEKYKYLPTE